MVTMYGLPASFHVVSVVTSESTVVPRAGLEIKIDTKDARMIVASDR